MKITNFYVIVWDCNSQVFKPYDIIPYLLKCYKGSKDKPKTFDDLKKFIEKQSMYMWWSRCEYEIILKDWPSGDKSEKWDIHKQVMMNINTIANIINELV